MLHVKQNVKDESIMTYVLLKLIHSNKEMVVAKNIAMDTC